MISFPVRSLRGTDPPMTHNFPFGPIVHLRGDGGDETVAKAIADSRNIFWFRTTQGPGSYCIPVINGTPVVHRYVIVDASLVRFPGEEVTRGAKS